MRFTLALALASLLVAPIAVPYCSSAATHGQGLARIVIETDSDLETVKTWGIPVYARTTGPDGTILITGTGPGSALSTSGLKAQILDPDTAGKQYYECYALPGRPAPDWAAYGNVLFEEAGRVILAASVENATRLAEAGAEIRAIILEPKPLPEAAPLQPAMLAVTADPDVQNMIDAVESLTVYNYTGDLSGEWSVMIGGGPYTITTRNTYSGEPITKATE